MPKTQCHNSCMKFTPNFFGFFGFYWPKAALGMV